jgi:hypothetical protein
MRELIEKWDGGFPQYFMGGSGQDNPTMLLQLPEFKPTTKPIAEIDK